MSAIHFDLGTIQSASLRGKFHTITPPNYALRRPISGSGEIAAEEAEAIRWAVAQGLIEPGTTYALKFDLAWGLRRAGAAVHPAARVRLHDR